MRRHRVWQHVEERFVKPSKRVPSGNIVRAADDTVSTKRPRPCHRCTTVQIDKQTRSPRITCLSIGIEETSEVRRLCQLTYRACTFVQQSTGGANRSVVVSKENGWNVLKNTLCVQAVDHCVYERY